MEMGHTNTITLPIKGVKIKTITVSKIHFFGKPQENYFQSIVNLKEKNVMAIFLNLFSSSFFYGNTYTASNKIIKSGE